MNSMKTALLSMFAVALAVAFAPVVAAQDANPFEVVDDVDGDGLVGPTDVQLVINAALGIRDRGPDAVRRFLRQFVVASPRAALVAVPQLDRADDDPASTDCNVAGATYNFPRENGRMVIRQGGVGVFRYDRNAEAVIYPGACGALRSELQLHLREVDPSEIDRRDADEPTTDGNAGDDLTNDTPPDIEPEWIPIGRDAVEGRDCGPVFGTGHVAVRHQFERPGAFVVRATISTYAIPAHDADDPNAEFCGASRSVDEVFIGVLVVNPLTEGDVDPDDIDWEDDGRPDEIHELFGRALDRQLDATVPLP